MRKMKDNEFDLAIVDPPYGMGMGATLNVNSVTNFIDKEWDKEVPTDEYFIELIRVSKEQIIWGGNYFPFLWKSLCKDFVVWNKMNHHQNRSAVEFACTSFNGLSKLFEYIWDGNRHGFPNKPLQGVGKPTIRIHPTQKPVALYKWLLKNYAKEGDTILDTHIGSGSSRMACWEMGFPFVGYEIDKDYWEAQEKRFNIVKNQQTIW